MEIKKRMHSGNRFRGITVVILCMMMVVAMVLSSGNAVKAATSHEALKAEIDQAEAELTQLKADQSAAAEKRARGTLSFIEYMLAKDDLTAAERQDLNDAAQIINDAIEEEFVTANLVKQGLFPAFRNNKVTVLRDRYDAISFDNYEIMFKNLRDVNYFRETDDLFVGSLKCSPAYTNFRMIAISQTGADRAAGYQNHTVTHNTYECLAFGYGANGVDGWYSEKDYFLEAMDQLGMSTITSNADVSKVSAKASANGKVVGHYTNMFAEKNQVMGIGYVKYGGYGNTTAYNASPIYNGTVKYTIDEFEDLYDEFYATVEPEQFVTAIAEKQAELDALYEEYYETCPGHRFTTSGTKDADCSTEGYNWEKCAECGYVSKSNIVPALGHDLTDGICSRCGIHTVKEVNNVQWTLDGRTVFSSDLDYEVGKTVSMIVNFSTAKDNKYDDEFVVEISDPSIVSFKSESNASGKFTMLKPGVVDIVIYPKEVPELAKTFHLDVNCQGGHNYVITEVQGSSATTHAVCSKCGFTREISVPTSINFFGFSTNGLSYSNYNKTFDKDTQIGFMAKMTGDVYYPGLDNNYVVVESSDESVVKYVSESYSTYNGVLGTLQTGKTGFAVLTAYLKYNPQVKVSQNVLVIGDDDVRVSSIGLDKTMVELDLTKNPTGKVNITYAPDNAAVKAVDWYIGNRSLVDIDPEGNITAKATGYTYAQAESLDGAGAESDWIYIYIYDTPKTPDVKNTDFTITETSIKSKLSTGFQYRIKKNGTWSGWTDTGSWAGLEVNTTYQIGVRTKGDGKYIKAGEEKVVNISTKDHSPVTLHAVAPKCTETGLTEGSQCSECKKILKEQKVIPATGHQEVTLDAVEATCTSNGMTEGSYCSVCGAVITPQKVVNAKGHKFVTDYAVAETCTEDGLTEGSHCSVCGMVKVKQERIPATGHDWDIGVVTTEPTCLKEGVKTFTCHNCGETKTQPVNKLNHGFAVYDKEEPTCTETGLTSGVYCPLCGTVFQEQQVIPAKGHKYGDWLQDPDNIDLIYRVCSVCDNKETSEHRWDNGTEEAAATCTTDGKIVYHCEDCDASYEEIVPADGHDPDIVKGYAATCKSKGLTDGIVCSVCKEVIQEQEEIPITDHQWDEGVETKAATYDEGGIMLYTCTSCGVTTEDHIPKLIKDGWFKEDGEWCYYVNDSLYDGSKGDLVYATLDGVSGWYMVDHGKIDRTFIGIAKTTSGKWLFAQNGMADSNFSGIALATNNIWYYCTDGKIDRTFTDKIAYCTNGKWYYVRNGKPTKSFTDKIAQATNGNWYYCKDGRPYTKFTGKIAHATDGAWYYCTNGRPDKKFTGIAMATNGTWYYVSKGVLTKSFTGVALATNGSYYYAKKGVLDKTFTGIAKDAGGKQYYVKSGKVNLSYSGTITYNGKKYKIVKGMVTQ